MRIAIFNDTSKNSHVGCQAVSDAHARYFESSGIDVAARYFNKETADFARGNTEAERIAAVLRSPIAAALRDVDAVVVNGEGTIHHGRGLDLLAVLGAAQELGKGSHLVNAVFQETPGFVATLQALDSLTVREPVSARALAKLGATCSIRPDSILQARFEERPRHPSPGRTLVTDWHGKVASSVGCAMEAFMQRTRRKITRYPLRSPEAAQHWRHALADFRSADCVVTARHHGAYLAAMAGRPFVLLASNSHKMEGFRELWGAFIPFCETAEEIERGLDAAQLQASDYAALAERLREPLADLLGRSPQAALPSERIA